MRKLRISAWGLSAGFTGSDYGRAKVYGRQHLYPLNLLAPHRLGVDGFLFGMRATLLHGAGDVRVEQVPDAVLKHPSDAVVRILASTVCGSDLYPYQNGPGANGPVTIGHEIVGVVEEVGVEVRTVRPGDLVICPWAFSDGTCEFCREGLYTSCVNSSMFDLEPDVVGQAEATRVPLADGTLVRIPGEVDEALLPSLLTLADVFGTGFHAAACGAVKAGSTVTVIGDGAVGLLAVLSARLLGAGQIILMGRHKARTDLGRQFGATHVVADRGPEGIEAVRALTAGRGSQIVLEAAGARSAYDQALGVVRHGGVISRVGMPQYDEAPIGMASLFRHDIRLVGGAAPVRAYIERLLPDVLAGTIDPGKVFDVFTDLDGVPEAYRLMAGRQALKVLVKP
ncbi:zinc-dependent alcohol dehydrogenase family protein [Kineosporia babensis]